jgi:hypothetical protein
MIDVSGYQVLEAWSRREEEIGEQEGEQRSTAE